MKLLSYLFLAAFIIIHVNLFFFPSNLSCQTTDTQIDVMLILDSSAGMKKTDPDNIRNSAAILFLSLLSKKDRAGIVSFNDRSQTINTLTPLSTDEDKEKLLNSINEIVSDGDFTNLYEAVRAGYEAFASDTYPRKGQPVAVLMSSGKMDTGDPDRDAQLVDILQSDLLKTVKKKGIRIFTIAFTEKSDKVLLKEIADTTFGTFYLASGQKDLQPTFISILELLKTPNKLPVIDGSFEIDVFTDKITLMATKKTPKTKIQLLSPGDIKHTSSEQNKNFKWRETTLFDMITIKNPTRGKWKILFSKGKNNKAYIATNLELISSLIEPLYPVKEKINIEVWIQKDGRLLEEKSLLRRALAYAHVHLPDGDIKKMVLYDEGNDMDRKKGDGIFSHLFRPEEEGEYKVTLAIKGLTFERVINRTFHAIPKNRLKEIKRKTATPKVETEEAEENLQDGADENIEKFFSWKEVLIKFSIINIALLSISSLFHVAYRRLTFISKFVNKLLKRKKK